MSNEYKDLQLNLKLNAVKNESESLVSRLNVVEGLLQSDLHHLDALGYDTRTIVKLLNRLVEVRDLAQIVFNELK